MKKVLIKSIVVVNCLWAGVVFADAGDLIVRGRLSLLHSSRGDNGLLPRTNTSLDSDPMPELDVTYMMTKNIGAELSLGLTRVELKTDLGNLGSVGAAPPTLTLQYHFSPDKKIRPYVGAGLNYTYFHNNDLNLHGKSIGIDKQGVGLALQVGTDVMINDKYFFNADVKYLTISTDAHIGSKSLGTLKANPWVFGIGIGRRFSLN
ncbi:OmpW/AlkL family protein [Hydromonas duriensis]|uniref:Outer membrane protein n=1 Tax=Hydromonas duriensis TaxID=1527608 RepID=A0A4R6Y8R6_9BURK|nr:OmpW family outer membrane protein [Hydromonas duriensis]TDR31788.1 outer membrane protein [Hydromonas duriensis]